MKKLFLFFFVLHFVSYGQSALPDDILSILTVNKSKSEVRNNLGIHGYTLIQEGGINNRSIENKDEDYDVFVNKNLSSIRNKWVRVDVKNSYLQVIYCEDFSYITSLKLVLKSSKNQEKLFDYLGLKITSSLRKLNLKKPKIKTSMNSEVGEFIRKSYVFENSSEKQFTLTSGYDEFGYFVELASWETTNCAEKLKEIYVDPVEYWGLSGAKADDLELYKTVFLWDIYNNVYKNDYDSFERFILKLGIIDRFNIYFKDIRDNQNKPDYNTIAIARGMFDDCGIEIQIDYNNWNEADYIKRIWILYHELAHDFFNIEHFMGGPLMGNTLPPKLTKEGFLYARKIFINYLRLLKFNPDCKSKKNNHINSLFDK